MVQKTVRRGRPLAFDPELVLDQAMQVFWRHGFESTSLEDLETATGLSRTSLYNTFGSKRELFERAIDRYQRSLAAEVLAPLEHGHEGLADLRAFVDAIARQLADRSAPPGCLMVNSMSEFGDTDPRVSREAARYTRRFRRAIEAALERAIGRSELADPDVREKTGLLLGLLLALNLAARAGLQSETRAFLETAYAQIDSWARGS